MNNERETIMIVSSAGSHLADEQTSFFFAKVLEDSSDDVDATWLQSSLWYFFCYFETLSQSEMKPKSFCRAVLLSWEVN